jgi:hypothetical protein
MHCGSQMGCPEAVGGLALLINYFRHLRRAPIAALQLELELPSNRADAESFKLAFGRL